MANLLSGDLFKKLKNKKGDDFLGDLFNSMLPQEYQDKFSANVEEGKAEYAKLNPPIELAKEDAVKEEERRAKKRQGRASTLLTSPFGVQGDSPLTSKKALLGY